MKEQRRNETTDWTPEQVAQLMRFVRDDLTAQEISTKLGRTEDAVHSKARQLGLSLSDGVRR